MGGRPAAWLVALPLVTVGWLIAHSLAYVVVAPDTHHRAQLLAETGHGYLGAAPIVVACALTVLFCGFGLTLLDRVRGAAGRPCALWPLAMAAPLGFAVQEHLERLIELHAFPAGAALEPTFLVGIALQLPFAAAALLIARGILELGDALGGALVATLAPRTVAVPMAPRRLRWHAPTLTSLPVLATGHAERAPPRRCA
jgi:hypothetical protein